MDREKVELVVELAEGADKAPIESGYHISLDPTSSVSTVLFKTRVPRDQMEEWIQRLTHAPGVVAVEENKEAVHIFS